MMDFLTNVAESRKVQLGANASRHDSNVLSSSTAVVHDAFRETQSLDNNGGQEFLWSAEEKAHIDREFERYAGTKDYVDAEDVRRIMVDLGVGQLSKDEVADIIVEYDHDQDGKLNRAEFKRIMTLKTTDADIAEGFAALDVYDLGAITPMELRAALRGMGFSATSADVVLGEHWSEGSGVDQDARVIGQVEFGELVRCHAALKVRLGILSRMGVLWLKSVDVAYKSNVRYRTVAQLLQEEAARVAAEGGGHSHGSGSEAAAATGEADISQVWSRPNSDGSGRLKRCCGKGCRGFKSAACCPCTALGRVPLVQEWTERLMKPYPVPPGEHGLPPPLHKLKPWKQGVEFLHRCRVGVLQYVAVQCIIAVTGFVGEKYFHEEWEKYGTVFFELILKNISQGWALYLLQPPPLTS